MTGGRRRLAHRLALSLLLTVALPGSALLVPVAAQAQADPKAVVSGFYDTLLSAMKEAKKLGFKGRYQRLEPAVEKAFDLPFMMSVAVGPSWSQLTPEQQKKLTDAFKRYTVAQYAGRFDDYSGERFEVGNVGDSKSGKLVESKLVQSNGESVTLNYLLRPAGSGMKIIDIFLTGAISQLAVNRAEFSGVIRRDGPDGLVALLDRKAQDFDK
jgi:phospholipid transport system substrate-binding protein